MRHCAKNVRHGTKNVWHGVREVYYGVRNVYHGARKVYRGVRKVYHNVRKVYHGVMKGYASSKARVTSECQKCDGNQTTEQPSKNRAFQIFQTIAKLGSLANLEFGNNPSTQEHKNKRTQEHKYTSKQVQKYTIKVYKYTSTRFAMVLRFLSSLSVTM